MNILPINCGGECGQTGPRITVIVPVYNTEKYLAQCLDSLVNQTLKEIEIICVDDCSDDGSAEILRRYAEADPRVKIISLPENKGTCHARKAGVRAAAGKHIMFADSDDSLDRDACLLLACTGEKFPGEIIQFSSAIHNETGKSDEVCAAFAETHTITGQRVLKDEELLTACFIDKSVNYNIWDKLYPAEPLKRAYEDVEDIYLPRAQDMYTSLVTLDKIRVLRQIPTKPLYHYCYGRGVSIQKSGIIDFEFVLNSLQRGYTVDAVMRYIEKNGGGFLQTLRRHFINNIPFRFLRSWLTKFTAEERRGMLPEILNTVPMEQFISLLYKAAADIPDLAAECFTGTEFPVNRQPVRRIAVIYHRFGNGGVQRKLSVLMPLWIKAGYEVIFITSESPASSDYELPDGVTRFTLLPPDDEDNDYSARGAALKKILLDNRIDTAVDFRGSERRLLFDLLTAKANGIRYIIAACETFTQGIAYPGLNLYPVEQKIPVYRLADGVTVLFETDKRLWAHYGINAEVIQNPCTIDLEHTECSKLDTKTVVWVGRLAKEQKRYMDIVPVMRKITAKLPEARILVIGKSANGQWEGKLRLDAEKYGLSRNIALCGYHQDISPFMRLASVCLCTSEYETFCNTVAEARAHGLPVVSYNMPYLTQFKQKDSGITAVPQGDINAAADACVRLLSDEQLRKAQGAAARKSLEDLMKRDVAEDWRKFFDEVGNGGNSTAAAPVNDEDIIIKTVIHHAAEAIKKRGAREQEIKQNYEKKLKKASRTPADYECRILNLEKALKSARKQNLELEEKLKQEKNQSREQQRKLNWLRDKSARQEEKIRTAAENPGLLRKIKHKIFG